MPKLYIESKLYHHGVLGMKWGVRRNRTSNSIGIKKKEKMKARYSERIALRRAASAVTNKRKDAFVRKANEANKRAIELDKEITAAKKARKANLQQKYSNLNPETIKKGAAAVATTALAATTVYTLYNNKGALINAGKKFIQASSKIRK